MDIPSLFMIPSAVSSGKVHSVFPNSTDADFDFNRDSSATRVNSQGLIEEVGYFSSELVTNGSFDTDSNWTKGTGWTISGGKANVNHTTFADLYQVIGSSVGKRYKIEFKVSNYVQGNVKVLVGYGGSDYGQLASANGVYNFETIGNPSGSDRIFLSTRSANTNLSVDYITVKEVTGDRARLNYEIEGGLVNTKPSLLLEPQSTNEVTYSEKFNEWSNVGGITLTSDISKSPDGSISADGIQDTSGGSFKRIRIVKGSISPNSTFTASVFVKKETSQINFGGIALVYQNVSTATSYGIIDAVNGTIVNGGGSITPAFNVVDFGNYWRFEMTSTDNGSNTAVEFAIYGTLSNNGTSLGVGAGSVRTIWGAQLEQQSYCTSYIPTNGSTQTRAAETCNGAGTSSILPSEEGILYTEISTKNDGNNKFLSINTGSSSFRITIYFFTSSNTDITTQVYNSSQQYAQAASGIEISNFNKIAVFFKANQFKTFINGNQIGSTDTSGTVPTGLNQISFDNGSGADNFYGKIRDIRVYNTKEMTDSEVDILLTKITS